jgi:hypothetical protein
MAPSMESQLKCENCDQESEKRQNEVIIQFQKEAGLK